MLTAPQTSRCTLPYEILMYDRKLACLLYAGAPSCWNIIHQRPDAWHALPCSIICVFIWFAKINIAVVAKVRVIIGVIDVVCGIDEYQTDVAQISFELPTNSINVCANKMFCSDDFLVSFRRCAYSSFEVFALATLTSFIIEPSDDNFSVSTLDCFARLRLAWYSLHYAVTLLSKMSMTTLTVWSFAHSAIAYIEGWSNRNCTLWHSMLDVLSTLIIDWMDYGHHDTRHFVFQLSGTGTSRFSNSGDRL